VTIKDTYRRLIRLLRHVTEIDDAGSEKWDKLIEDLPQQHIYIIACDSGSLVIYSEIPTPATNTEHAALNNTSWAAYFMPKQDVVG